MLPRPVLTLATLILASSLAATPALSSTEPENPSLNGPSGWFTQYAPLFPGATDRGFRVVSDGDGNFIAAGETLDDRHGDDLLVFKYAGSTGELLWQYRYNGSLNADDTSSALAVNSAGDVFVAATSRESGSLADFYVVRLDGTDGSLVWEQRHNGPGNNTDSATAIVLDSGGNALVTGYEWNGTSFDMRTLKLAGGNGQILWQRAFNGSANGEDLANSITVDEQGNAIVAGYTFNGIDNDYLTGKYRASDGEILWEKIFAGPSGADAARLVAVNAEGDVVVTGTSSNGANNDILTLLYTEAGTLDWERRYNGPGNGNDGPRGLAFDHEGHVVVAGSVTGLTSNDISVARYDIATGDDFWERVVGSATAQDFGFSMDIDPGGNIFVTGRSDNGTDLDFYTIRLSHTEGLLQWEKYYQGEAEGDDFAWSVALNGSGRVVVTGVSENTLNNDFLTVSYDATSGEKQWEQRYNGPKNSFDRTRDVAVDMLDNVLVTGNSWNGANYDQVTMKFEQKTGELLWEARYDGPVWADTFGSGAIDSYDGDVVVTTSSWNGQNFDFYTARYSGVDGSLVWERRYDGTGGGDDFAMDVLIDPSDGIVIVTGVSEGVDTGDDFYTAMYAWQDGLLLWQHRYDGFAADDWPEALALDHERNFMVTGRSSNGLNDDILTIKYDGQSGAPWWTRRLDVSGGNTDRGRAVTVDPEGNVAVTGTTYNGANVDINVDIYTAKLAREDGTLLWEKIYDGPVEGYDVGEAIGVDAAGDVVITGWSEDEASPGGPIEREGYTAKYAASDGSLLWSRRNGRFEGTLTHSSLDLDSEGKVGLAHTFLVTPSESFPPPYVVHEVQRLSSNGETLWYDSITSGTTTDTNSFVRFTGADNLALAAEVEDDFFARLYVDYPWPLVPNLIFKSGFESP